MAKKKVVDDSIENFSFLDISAVSIDLTRVAEDDGVMFYPHLVLHLKIENHDDGTSTTSKAIILPTALGGECDHCVLTEACVLVNALFGADILAGVQVFDEDGEFIQRLDLNSLEREGEEQSKEYDLENMKAGVPVIH